MESNLLSSIWAKLVEALRFQKPTKRPQAAPVDEREQDAFTVYSNGVPIKGRVYFPAERPDRLYPVLIICHGIPGSGDARPVNDPGYEQLAQDYASEGIAAVFFNFRGCGDSGGDFSMSGWVNDLEVVIDKVLNTPHIDPSRLLILGFSGGGAAALRVAAENAKIFAMAVVGTPADFEIFDDEPSKIVEDFRERGIIRHANFPANISEWMHEFVEVQPKKWISQFQGQHLLIVQGDADDVVPVEHAQILYDNAPAGVAELSIIPGGEHRLRLNPTSSRQVKDWFLKALSWK